MHYASVVFQIKLSVTLNFDTRHYEHYEQATKVAYHR